MRCIIFTHLLFFPFFLVWLAVEICIRAELCDILGIAGAGCVVVISNAVVLPVMYRRKKLCSGHHAPGRQIKQAETNPYATEEYLSALELFSSTFKEANEGAHNRREEL